ncbi:MAG: hypothetical protein ACT4PE_06880 [Candidatus Eiseniibacteriota bacterium]
MTYLPMMANRAFPWLALVAALGFGAPAAEAKDPPRETEQVRTEVEALERLVELASSSSFYLVLDPDGPRLTLRLRGVVLHEYQVTSVELARQRVGFFPRGEAPEIEARVWSGGELDPPRNVERVVFTAPEPDPTREEGSVEVPLPPPIEDVVPVPPRFGLRFADGPVVQFRAAAQKGSAWKSWTRKLSGRFADLFEALRGGDPVRLRISLSPEDHASFYRSLPPEVRFLIHREGGAAGKAEAKDSVAISESESRRSR